MLLFNLEIIFVQNCYNVMFLNLNLPKSVCQPLEDLNDTKRD